MMMQSTSSGSSTASVEQALQSGINAMREQRFDEAEAQLKTVLQMEGPLLHAYQGLGELYFKSKRWAEAVRMLERAVAIAPSHIGFHLLGQCYMHLNRKDAALPAFVRAADLKPGWEAPLWFLGDLYRKQASWPEAQICYEKLKEVGTDKILAQNFLAQCLHGLERFEEAEAAYQAVIKERPEMPEPYCSMGALYRSLGRLDEVEACYLKALELHADFPEALYNLGNFYKSQQRYTEAATAFRKAMALRPGYVEAEWNLALVLLIQDDYLDGWKAYQARLVDPYFSMLPAPKRWRGQNLEGKRLLVMREQGFGDTLQFLRYTRLLKAQGATVLFEMKPALESLLATCPFISETLPPRAIEVNPNLDFDYWIPLMTLPEVFKTTITSIPAAEGLLLPDVERAQSWAARIPKEDTLRVGIAWTGNPENPYNADREFPLELVLRLAELPGVTLYSLQKENGLKEPHSNIVDVTPQLESFMDTAAVIENLDVVISVDSAISHLAGTLGKPVYVVLPAVADWRWGLEREDSPWYPSARVFRQPEPGNWQPVYEQLEQVLTA